MLSDNKIQGTVFDHLTKREKEIVALILNGLSNLEMAQELSLKANTISTFRKSIYEKLSINNDVDLTLLAIREGILEVPQDSKIC